MKLKNYTLQLDSHHRFIKDWVCNPAFRQTDLSERGIGTPRGLWDIILINMLEQLRQKYHKPVLTCYSSDLLADTLLYT